LLDRLKDSKGTICSLIAKTHSGHS